MLVGVSVAGDQDGVMFCQPLGEARERERATGTVPVGNEEEGQRERTSMYTTR